MWPKSVISNRSVRKSYPSALLLTVDPIELSLLNFSYCISVSFLQFLCCVKEKLVVFVARANI